MEFLGSLASNSSCQLDVFWHDGDTLGVNCAEVGVFEKANKVGFRCFLKSTLFWTKSKAEFVLGELR